MGLVADHPGAGESARVDARPWRRDRGATPSPRSISVSSGQYDYDAVPAIPPEIVSVSQLVLLQHLRNFFLVAGNFGSAVDCYAKKPFKKIPPEQGIDELFVGGRENANSASAVGPKTGFAGAISSWCSTGWCTGRARPHPPAAQLALQARRRSGCWQRLEMSDGLGAIYPAMLNCDHRAALPGYSQDDPQVIRALDEFEKLGIEEPGVPDESEPTFRMQPCMSPVWDTAQAIFALGEAGVPQTDPRLLKAADWMLSKEVRHKGDWAVKVRNVQPGGWYFEFNNEFYPDIDDSAQVLLALNKVDNPRERYQYDVSQRAIDWIFAMQCKNGGWAQLRQGQHQDDLPAHPVRRPQRDARSADGRHHRTHAGDAGHLRLHAARIQRVKKAIQFI